MSHGFQKGMVGFFVLIDWDEWAHVLRVTCEVCGKEAPVRVGIAMDWQRHDFVEWMVQHRRSHVGAPDPVTQVPRTSVD